MKVLIDTHILLWAIISPQKLKASQKKILEDGKNEIYVSVISLWEISLKHSLGKLQLENVTMKNILKAIKDTGFELLDLSPLEAISFHELPKLNNKDPFDRMLIWQAIQNDFAFMSQDSKMKGYENIGLSLI